MPSERLKKRIFDIIVTTLILPIGLVLMFLIAIAVRLETPGRIILRQKRVGEGGKIFEMFKFRTMIRGADEVNNIAQHIDGSGRMIYKIKQDPRITSVGHFLRRSSLDELPQLINVLIGDMSLVGPRPELPLLFKEYQPWQHARLCVPQGITGWWQVNGRSNKPLHLNTEDDLFYIEHYSVWLDIQILIKTVSVVLHSQGAF